MRKQFFLFGVTLVLISCSGSVDVDAAKVLPGSWLCDDGIVITFNSSGRYEWRVPKYPETEIYVESNDQIRMNEDGGHSILDKWRLSSDKLEMDMLGVTDRYELEFKSESAFRMSGPDTFTCQKQ